VAQDGRKINLWDGPSSFGQGRLRGRAITVASHLFSWYRNKIMLRQYETARSISAIKAKKVKVKNEWLVSESPV
jgi:hypothetical protein